MAAKKVESQQQPKQKQSQQQQQPPQQGGGGFFGFFKRGSAQTQKPPLEKQVCYPSNQGFIYRCITVLLMIDFTKL